jgi:hypothetical protein
MYALVSFSLIGVIVLWLKTKVFYGTAKIILMFSNNYVHISPAIKLYIFQSYVVQLLSSFGCYCFCRYHLNYIVLKFFLSYEIADRSQLTRKRSFYSRVHKYISLSMYMYTNVYICHTIKLKMDAGNSYICKETN